MSSKKASIPDAPSFQTDPNVGWSQEALKGQFDYLMKGLTTEGGSLSGLLGDTINVNPLTSQYAQQLAQSQLDPAYRTQRQDLINTLEANNQLTGSTTGSSLSNLEADYMSALTGMQAQFGLADVDRALNNRVQLYEMGLHTGQAVGSNALSNQNQMNQFALANYENQVAAAMMGQSQSAWGQLGGMALGAGAGFALGGSTGAALGAGIGGSLGGAVFGGTEAGNALSSGLGGGAAYMMGSKYSAPGNIYAGGTETTQNTLMNQNPYYQPLNYANSGRAY